MAASACQASAPPADFAALGKVTTLGPREAWQVALLLPQPFSDPSAYQDLREVFDRLDAGPVGVPAPYRLQVATPPSARFGPPRLALKLADTSGRRVSAIAYGELQALRDQLVEGTDVLLIGKRMVGDTGEFFSIEDVVPAAWAGRVRPKYPGNGKVIGAAMVRERVLRNLAAAVPRAAAFIEAELAAIHDPRRLLQALGANGWSLTDLIRRAHLPRSPEEGIHAQGILERIAALVALWKAHQNRPLVPVARRLNLATLPARLDAAPVPLTDEQRAAAQGIARELEGPYPARCVLSADTGYGKSFPYQAVLAAAVDDGARALVLLPNYPMAEQAHREFSTLYPDLPAVLVTGETDARIPIDAAPLVFGTTALLHRDAGARELVVVDEQQRFNVAQREAYVREGTHLIEVSATCIPRTQALVSLGVVHVSTLTCPHTPKTIHTRYWAPQERQGLLRAIHQTLAAGDRVFVIYPARGDDVEDEGDIRNVRAATVLWEKRFPGRVRGLTGGDRNDVKQSVLADLREGRADLLVATSLIEVGVSVGKVRRLVVINAEAFGLTQLHQLRGRIAREGGEGHFDLYTPDEPPATAKERFDLLCRISDGFSIAEADMRRRGFGDLAPGSLRQSGADGTLLFGRPISLDTVDVIAPVYAALSQRRRTRSG